MREEVRNVERLSHMLEAINVLINYKEHHTAAMGTGTWVWVPVPMAGVPIKAYIWQLIAISSVSSLQKLYCLSL